MTVRVTTLPDRRIFEGQDPAEVVYRMMQASLIYATEADPSRYMRHTAKRVRVWNGSEMDFEDEGTFLKSLQIAGLAIIEDGGN